MKNIIVKFVFLCLIIDSNKERYKSDVGVKENRQKYGKKEYYNRKGKIYI